MKSHFDGKEVNMDRFSALALTLKKGSDYTSKCTHGYPKSDQVSLLGPCSWKMSDPILMHTRSIYLSVGPTQCMFFVESGINVTNRPV